MTEDEAKTKACCGPEWCGKISDNALVRDFGVRRSCVGSVCMGWRTTALGGTRYASSPDNASQRTETYPAQGFCGLAGQP
jgi:hypothetical protein